MDLFVPQPDTTQSIAQELQKWFGMKLKESLDWPSFACLNCVETVAIIQRFQDKITASHSTLQELIVKDEEDEEEYPDPDKQEADYQIEEESYSEDTPPINETIKEESIIDTAENDKKPQKKKSRKKEGQVDKPPKMQFVTDPERGYQCPTCEKWFKDRLQVRNHMKWHLPKDQRPAKCDQCPKTFTDIGALTRHVERVHDVAERHFCEVCGKAYSNKYTLWQHVKNHKMVKKTGKIKKLPKCKECGEETSKMRLHMLNIHGVDCGPSEEDKQMIPCEQCKKEVPKYRMDKHVYLIHTRPPISCSICGMTFIRYAARQRHMDQHLDREYPCPHCDKINKSSQGRLLHIKSHHPEEYLKVSRKIYKPKDQ